MATGMYVPISGAPLQYLKRNGTFAAYYFLKMYESGTTTPLKTAFKRTGLDVNGQNLTYDKVQLDTAGYPINPSGGTGNLHSLVGYKLVLYKNATDANANNISQAEWVVDECFPGLLGLDEEDKAIYAYDITYTADPTAEDRTVENKLQEWISVKDFGAKGDGTTDDSVPIATALQVTNNLLFPSGTYLCNGLIIQNQFQSIWFHSNVALKASVNDVVLFRQITSDSKHKGGFRTLSNGKTNVTGMRVGPSDPANISNFVNQKDNTLPEIIGDAGITELVTVQCGPDVSGNDSECSGNVFPKIVANSSRRALWLRSSANASATVPKNNLFHIVTAGAGSNTGVLIDAGLGNTFIDVQLVGINNGSTPLATPTGYHVADTCAVTGTQNINNNVLGGRSEGNTRNLYLGNEYNKWLPEFISPMLLNYKEYRTPKSSNVRYIFQGTINSSGTSSVLPTGWSSSKTSTGTYRITHGLGTNALSISVTPLGNNKTFTGAPALTTTYFDVEFRVHNSADLVDTAFTFEVSRAWT